MRPKSLTKRGIPNQGALCPNGCLCANYIIQLSTQMNCKGTAEVASVPIFCLVK